LESQIRAKFFFKEAKIQIKHIFKFNGLQYFQ
jgi:hypothetical protein